MTASLREAVTSVRARALAILGVLAALLVTTSLSPPFLAAALLLGALAAAVLVRPDVRRHWAFNVTVGLGMVLYGVVYALARSGTVVLVLAALIVVVGLLIVGNHLGLVPWSDHPRRI